MKKTLVLTLLLFMGLSAFGQIKVIPTTLSAAITSTSSQTVVVAAATGLNSNSYAIAANSTYLYIDGEFMAVSAVNSTTLTVIRGYSGSRAMTHASGAYVFAGPASFFSSSSVGLMAGGSCTRANVVALPRPDVQSQAIFDCLGGYWTAGQNSNPVGFSRRVSAPNPGGVLYTGINTNGTTLGATTMYCSEVNLTVNKLVTGMGVLNGTTVGTDKHLVVLYDASGNLLYNSATAGATSATASNYQEFNFTTTGYLVGPARYFGCVQTNGTTDTIRMAVTGQADLLLTKGVTGVTFGTVPATLAVPTTFTTAVGPFVELY